MKRTKGRVLRERVLSMLLALTMLFSSIELTAFATEQDPSSGTTTFTEETVTPEDSGTTDETGQDEDREETDGTIDSDQSDDSDESTGEEGSDKADDSDGTQNPDGEDESGESDGNQDSDDEEETDGSDDTQDPDEADESEEPEGDEETETTGPGVLESSDIKLHTESSLGRLFEDAISTEVTKELQETGSGVYSVIMNGTQATVSLQTVHSGTLVVGVYEDSGVKLIATGSTEVAAGDTEAVVAIEADSLPEYFYLKAYLVDTKSFRPYCEVYESEEYTEKMQVFYAKTTGDFDGSHILNLDEDESNNFIVFTDSVKVIPRSGDAGTNKVIECDEDKLIYKIQNPDEKFRALEEGDIFVYYYADNEAIITKVLSVNGDEDGGSVLTIYGEEPDFDAIIDFIKVGAENPKDTGISSYASLYAVEEASKKWSLPDWSKEEDGITVGVSDIGGESTIRIFRDSREEIEKSELEISYGAKVSLSGELFNKEKRWKLGEPTMPTNIPAVTISCTIEIKLEVEVSLNVAGTLSGSIGVAIDKDGDVTKIGKSPTFTVTKGAEVSVSLGFVFTPQLVFIHEKILSAGLEIDFGLKLTFTSDDIIAVIGSERHACEECYGITFGPYLSITGKVVLLLHKEKIDLLDKDWTAAEAYYSVDYNKFGLGTCPYKEYKVTVKVRNLKNKLITGANVNNVATTDKGGKAMVWLSGGDQVIYAVYDGETGSVFANIDGPKEVYVTLSIITGMQNDNAVAQVALGGNSYRYSAAVTKDGSLYMWGNNYYGQLGDGSKTNKLVPTKIMDNVRTIKTSDRFCAAITIDNKLYMWGDNSYGQLGDGTTDSLYKPTTPVLYDVKDVILSQYFSAAIKTDGSLWMWGDNLRGQLGDGTTDRQTTPVKILENVREVSLGAYHGAAIKTDGSLWVWGNTYYGQIGNGTKGSASNSAQTTPLRLMENVKEVSLGEYHSAAVKNDGSLWLWGSNTYGQIGNFKTADQLEPLEISLDGQRVKTVCLAQRYSIAITESGSLYTWGNNTHNQLGNGLDDGVCTYPKLILDNVEQVITGDCWYSSEFVAAIKTDGSLWMWGANYYGQTGTGETTSAVKTPKKVLDNVVQVSLSNSEVYNGSSSTNGHSAAITKDGSLWIWGHGQLGDGKTTTTRTPLKLDFFSPSSDIAAAAYALEVFGNVPSITQDASNPARQTASFTGLHPEDIYNVYVMKSRDGENPLGSDNLLYITQAVSGADGNLGITYEMKEAYDSPEVFCVALTQTDLSGAEVSVDNVFYDGEEHMVEPVVVLDGVTLTAGTDYEVYGETVVTEVGEYKITVKGIGEYCGQKEVTYRVTDVELVDLSSAEIKVSDIAHDGNEHRVTVTVTYDGQLLAEGTDYELTGDILVTEIGEYRVIVKGIGLYCGEREVLFRVKEAGSGDDPDPDDPGTGVLPGDVPADGIPDGLWIAGIAAEGYPYTGQAIKPEVRVYDGETRLTAGKDYTISYKNNTNANDISVINTAPTITVTGKGNYGGSEKAVFKITPIDLEDKAIGMEDIVAAYNGKVQKPVPVVTFGGKKLSNNKDYTVEYPSQGADAYKSAAEYEILVKAKEGGNFTGRKTIKLTITEKPLISKATVAKINNQPYNNGEEVKPALTVKLQGKTLSEGTDYTVAYRNNRQVGTATAVITGTGNYAGTKSVTFKIVGTAAISKAKISGISGSYTYSGKAYKPEVTLTLNEQTLVCGTDYEVTYANNIKAGKAAVIVKGIGAYTGSIKKTFKINPYNMDEDEDEKIEDAQPILTVKYVKGGCQPDTSLSFDGVKLVKGTDYTITYRNNKKLGSAVMIIKGKGNFKGSREKSFTIRKKALNDEQSPIQMALPDVAFVDKAGKYMSKPVLTDSDGKKLVAGADYDKNITYTLEDGTVLDKTSKPAVGTKITVTVTGKGKYNGTLSGSYKITKTSFNNAKITVKAKPYTGKPVEITEEDITIKIGNTSDFVLGRDYEIVADSYQNNINKGTASVTIKGKGEYGGTKTVKFKITSKSFAWVLNLFG